MMVMYSRYLRESKNFICLCCFYIKLLCFQRQCVLGLSTTDEASLCSVAFADFHSMN